PVGEKGGVHRIEGRAMVTMAVSSTPISWATAITTRASPSDLPPRVEGLNSTPLRGRVGVAGPCVAIVTSSLPGRQWLQLENWMALRLMDEVGHRRIGGQGVKAAKKRRLQRRLEARPEHLLQNGTGGFRGQLDGGNHLAVLPAAEDPLPCRAQITRPVGLAEGRQQPATPVLLEESDRGGPGPTAGSAAHGKQGHRPYGYADSKQTQDQRIEDRDVARHVRGFRHVHRSSFE